MRHPYTIISFVSLAALVTACDALTSDLEPEASSVPTSAIIDVKAALQPPDQSESRSLAVITAELPVKATSRNVTFTASGGAFVENAGKTITVRGEVNADSTHVVASTVLRDLATETVIVRGSVGDRYDTVSVAFIKRP